MKYPVRLVLLAIVYFLLLAAATTQTKHHSVPVRSLPEDTLLDHPLPNDCAIVATEAYLRLKATGVWVRMVHTEFRDLYGSIRGHMVVVWQPIGCPVLTYDAFLWNGTIELPTYSRNAADLLAAMQTVLNDSTPRYKLTHIHYLQ